MGAMPGRRSNRGGARSGRLACLALGLFAAGLALAPGAGALTASYEFTGSTQGWNVAQGSGGPFAAPSYDPGGFIFAQDTGPDSGCPDANPCNYFFFAGPPLVTTLAANYGGTISFDYSTNVFVPGATGILYIETSNSSGADLGYVFSIPGPGFQRISIPLIETAGWRYCQNAPRTCAPASRQQFETVLSAGVYTDVLADTIVGTGETYALDNFSIAELPAPPKTNKKKCRKGKKGDKGKKRKNAKKCKRNKKKGKRGKRKKDRALAAGAAASNLSR